MNSKDMISDIAQAQSATPATIWCSQEAERDPENLNVLSSICESYNSKKG